MLFFVFPFFLFCLFSASFAQVSDENYRYFAVGADSQIGGPGAVMKSVDGIFWTSVSTNPFGRPDAGRLYSVGVGNGVWLAFGHVNKKYRSIAGAAFDVTAFPDSNAVMCLVYGAGMWVACDPSREDQNGVRVSGVLFSVDNGTSFTWSPAGMVGIRDAVYSESLRMWVGVSSMNKTGSTAVSSDGINWDASGSDADQQLFQINAVAFSPQLGRFVAVGFVGRAPGTSPIISSADGRTWSPLGGTSVDVGRANDVVVAANVNGTDVIVVVGEEAPSKGKMSQIVVRYFFFKKKERKNLNIWFKL